MVGPKKQEFWPRINILKGLFLKFVDELRFIKKCQNCTFKVNFQCQKSTDFFQNKLRLRPNILAKRLGSRSLSRLKKNFGLGLLTNFNWLILKYVDPWICIKMQLFISDRPVRYQINIGGNFKETSKDISNLIMRNFIERNYLRDLKQFLMFIGHFFFFPFNSKMFYLNWVWSSKITWNFKNLFDKPIENMSSRLFQVHCLFY